MFDTTAGDFQTTKMLVQPARRFLDVFYCFLLPLLCTSPKAINKLQIALDYMTILGLLSSAQSKQLLHCSPAGDLIAQRPSFQA